MNSATATVDLSQLAADAGVCYKEGMTTYAVAAAFEENTAKGATDTEAYTLAVRDKIRELKKIGQNIRKEPLTTDANPKLEATLAAATQAQATAAAVRRAADGQNGNETVSEDELMQDQVWTPNRFPQTAQNRLLKSSP